VAIGVLIAQKNLNTIGRAALQTWVSEARAHGILVLFFGAFEDPVSAVWYNFRLNLKFDGQEFPVIKVSDNDDRKKLATKVKNMFKYFKEHHGDKDWYLKVCYGSFIIPHFPSCF